MSGVSGAHGHELVLTDTEDLADLDTFLARARDLGGSGAVRLAAGGATLAVTVEAVPGGGLLGEGTVLGMRVLGLSEAADHDAVVPIEAVTDRLARMRREGSLALPVPPMTVRVPWAALTPPRRGWEPLGVLEPDLVRAQAEEGVAAVAEGAPAGSGAAAVADLRRRIWSRPLLEPAHTGASAAPAGLAFGAYTLGFLAAGPITLHRTGRWWRLSTPTGHVLAR